MTAKLQKWFLGGALLALGVFASLLLYCTPAFAYDVDVRIAVYKADNQPEITADDNGNGTLYGLPRETGLNQPYDSRNSVLVALYNTATHEYIGTQRTTVINGYAGMAHFANLPDGTYKVAIQTGFTAIPNTTSQDADYTFTVSGNTATYVMTNKSLSSNTIYVYSVHTPVRVDFTTTKGTWKNGSTSITYMPGGVKYYDRGVNIVTDPLQYYYFQLWGPTPANIFGAIRSSLPEPTLSDTEQAEGWRFIGWKIAGDSTDTIYSTAEILNMKFSSNVTLEAQHALNMYTFQLQDEKTHTNIGSLFYTRDVKQFSTYTETDLFNPQMLNVYLSENHLELAQPFSEQLARIQEENGTDLLNNVLPLYVRGVNTGVTFVLQDPVNRVVGKTFWYDGETAVTDLTSGDVTSPEGLDAYLTAQGWSFTSDFQEQVASQAANLENGKTGIIYLHVNGSNLKGDKGDTGETGATGPQGPQGEKGEKGDTGATGATGLTGPQGPQGEKGEKGDPGVSLTPEVAIAGATYVYNSTTNNNYYNQYSSSDTSVQGAQGEKGEKGDKGDKGDTGEKGEKGDPGTSYVCCEGTFLWWNLYDLCCYWIWPVIILFLLWLVSTIYFGRRVSKLKNEIADRDQKFEEITNKLNTLLPPE